jgi:rhodanese-related sulfurtransferase
MPRAHYHVGVTVTLDAMRGHVRDPDVVVLDVLSSESYAALHLPGAINIPLEELAARAPAELPDRARPLVVYCAGPTCPRAEEAVALLRGLGYTHVVPYRGGLEEWQAAALPVEGGEPVGAQRDEMPRRQRPSPKRRDRWVAFVDFFEDRTTADLVWIWLGTITVCSVIYWTATAAGLGGLVEGGERIGADARGFLDALYFSFGAASTIALGDVAPIGALRPLAIAEAVVGLLVFGGLVTKLLSRRQEQIINEIHRIAFEDRLERVQTDLHLVLAELQGITQLCRAPDVPEAQIRARIDSASGICLAELRTIHDLLYRPQTALEEAMLEGILASLSIVMRELSELLRCLTTRSPYLARNLELLSSLADDICADCVPRQLAPNLREWMDIIQSVARDLR